MAFPLPHQPPFSIQEARDTVGPRWEKWLKRFNIFLDAFNIVDPHRRKSMLLYYAGQEVQDIFDTFLIPNPLQQPPGAPPHPDEYITATQALNNYFLPKCNIVVEEYKFRKATQMTGESIDDYTIRLKSLAVSCAFHDKNKEILGHLIQTCSSTSLRRKALREPTMTLDDFLTLAKSYELAEEQANLIEHRENLTTYAVRPLPTPKPLATQRGHTQQILPQPPYQPSFHQPPYQHPSCSSHQTPYHHPSCSSHHLPYQSTQSGPHFDKRQNSGSNKRIPPNNTSSELICYNCGGNFPHAQGRNACPARLVTCSWCGILGHMEHMCRSKAREVTMNSAAIIMADKPPEESDFATIVKSEIELSNICTLTDAYYHSHNKMITIFNIGGLELPALKDSGACINILDFTTFSKLNPRPSLDASAIRVFPYASNEPLPLIGKFSTTLTTDQQRIEDTFHVLHPSRSAYNIIGAPTLEKLHLLPKTTPVNVDSLAIIHKHNTDTHENILGKYSSVFEGIGKLRDYQAHIYVNEHIPPIAIHHQRIPFHLRPQVTSELNYLLDNDIIEPATGPTTWLSPLVVVPKPNKQGEIRICIDRAILRERHTSPKVEDFIYVMNGMKLFSRLDLNKGYHQLELDEASRNVTTFSSHIGLFRYKRLNFGVSSAAEIFQKAIENVIAGIPNVKNTSDDILIEGTDEMDHNIKLEAVLKRLREHGLTLNKEKCTFLQTSLTFLGHIFSNEGIKPNPKKVEALESLPAPKNLHELRSFLGLANYCARFIPNFASITEPLRNLTKKTTEWIWTSAHDEAMRSIKDTVKTAATLCYFDPSKLTTLHVDASPFGVAAMLSQTDLSGREVIIAFASRTLSPTEKRYSQVEREALAIVFGCEHYHLFLSGTTFVILTDHKPLVTIFNNPRSFTSIRIQRWILRLQQYEFEVRYQPGKINPVDYLSRHPHTNFNGEQVAEVHLSALLEPFLEAITLEDVKRETANDQILALVQQAIRNESLWATYKPDDVEIKRWYAYKKIRQEIAEVDGLLLRGNRVILPQTLESKAIAIAHEGHPGIVRTKQTIRDKVWFPNIDAAVEKLILSCIPCQSNTPNQQFQPVQMTPLPDHPWMSIAMDYFGPTPSGEYILILADEYSRYPITTILPSTTTTSAINALTNIFSIFGIPAKVKTDNGAPFNATAFSNFAREYGFIHQKVTPRWPQANGLIERQMPILAKTIRTALLDGTSWKSSLPKYLLNFRATTHPTTGKTPAILFFNRNINTRLPTYPSQSPHDAEVRHRDSEKKAKMKENSDIKHNARLHEIKIGDQVLPKLLQRSKFDPIFDPNPWQVINVQGSQISIRNTKGNILRRNCSMVKPIIPNNSKFEDKQDIYQNAYDSDIKPSHGGGSIATRATNPIPPTNATAIPVESTVNHRNPSTSTLPRTSTIEPRKGVRGTSRHQQRKLRPRINPPRRYTYK